MKTILVDAIDGLILRNGTVFQAMCELLETYPNRKIVLTGANDEEFEKFNLSESPYEVFTLKHNPDKTDPAYFEALLGHLNLGSDEVIYFEHNAEAVKSAESVGIKSYYYDHTKEDLVALSRFINTNL